jgi:hypothetical protein
MSTTKSISKQHRRCELFVASIVGQCFYNGDGQRIRKVVPSTGETTIFVYDASSKLVAEYSKRDPQHRRRAEAMAGTH